LPVPTICTPPNLQIDLAKWAKLQTVDTTALLPVHGRPAPRPTMRITRYCHFGSQSPLNIVIGHCVRILCRK